MCIPHPHECFHCPINSPANASRVQTECVPLQLSPHSSAACVTIFPNGLGAPCRQGVYTCPSSKLQAQPWPLTPSTPPSPPLQPGLISTDLGGASHLLVRTCFHFPAGRVRACRVYLAMGLWLSKPRLQLSWTVVSPMSLTTTPPGGPGGPAPRGQSNKFEPTSFRLAWAGAVPRGSSRGRRKHTPGWEGKEWGQ